MEDVINKILTLNLTYEERSFLKEIATFISELAVKYHVNEERKNNILHTIAYFLNFRLEDNERNGSYVKVQVLETSSSLKISITDKGTPYLMSKEEADLLKNGWVDAYSNERLAKDGQRITFIYKIKHQDNIEINTSEDEEVLLDKNFTFRPTKSTNEDINEVIKCLYNAYGYDYGHQDLYDFDKFKKMLKSKHYKSFLIENDHHQVVSHVGLTEHNNFKGLPEIGNLVTKIYARGNSLGDKAVKELLDFERNKNEYNGLFIASFAAHPITEKIANKQGFTPCAFYFQNISPEACGSYRKGDTRLDCAYAIKMFDDNRTHKLYVAEETLPLVKDVFNKESLKYVLDIDDVHYELDKPSEVSFFIDKTFRILEIRVDYYGFDYEDYIKTMMDAIEGVQVDVVTVFINVNNSSGHCLYNDCKDDGYIFSGILPGSNNGDYIIMQKFIEPLDTTNAVVISGYDTLLESIKKINKI